jgi:uncharacterized protein YjeT (DUF2065 family)
MSDLVAAVGLVLVIEGVLYGGFPALARRIAAQAASMPDELLRIAGLGSVAVGVFIVWLVRG